MRKEMNMKSEATPAKRTGNGKWKKDTELKEERERKVVWADEDKEILVILTLSRMTIPPLWYGSR